MDSTKPGRRRIHEPEWEESNPAKRKRKRDIELDNSDSVQIVGETHTHNMDFRHLDGHLRGAHGIESTRRLLPNGACAGAELHGQHGLRGPVANGATRVKDRPVNGVHRGDTHSSSTPTLPPSLRESERMLFVQQWINTIPADLPLWVQTSLTKIVPITHPEYYPEEDDRRSSSDCFGCEGQSHSPNDPPTHRHSGPGKVDHVTTQLGGYAPYPMNHSHPPTGHQSLTTAENGKTGLDQNRSATVGRLFDDVETEMVVKLFRDYFTKGSCPILSEVRRRTANTPLDGRRTAVSIRAKIKRLQSSGRWTNYTGL
ncbi:hypothetical protein D915_005870 [Fasciola hepatica]|uniref:Uncharacterized protein n=1 Tax=Fasciola hepatica TaxID=6192 RepID=A0A4E0S0F1_FASHE|nr:hypothetical protein D915_005870 [Fasciola hepatica]